MAIYVLMSLFGMSRLALEGSSGHLRTFTLAAHALWNGQDPYGYDLGAGGLWLYSPTTALLVFGPLSPLPPRVAVLLFMAISWIVFTLGMRFFAREALGQKGRELLW